MYARRFSITLIALASLALPAVLHAQTPVGTVFTYQGQLKQAGEPVDDTADFEFTLWDAETGGAQVGPMVPVSNWLIEGGLFTVLLDFGQDVFTGDARWLEVAVRSPGGSGDFTTLSPRQPLTATAYALYALSGPGSGGFWAASGNDIYNTNTGDVGIGTTNPQSPLHVWSDGSSALQVRNASASGGTAISASATAESGYAYAVNAYLANPNGACIYAFNEAESGSAYTFHGENISPDGIAIRGIASNSGEYSTGIGVYGRSNGDYGAAGVYGEATNTGNTYGVRGVSAHGTGVRGENTDTGNHGLLGSSQYGVEGRGDSAGGHFEDTDGSGQAYVGFGDLGIDAEGNVAGGHFEDSDGSGLAYVGYGDYGIEAAGDDAGGFFRDSDGSGRAWVGYGEEGIYAIGFGYGVHGRGDPAGGYFESLEGDGYAYVGNHECAIEAVGDTTGGYFEGSDGSAYAYVGHSYRGIEAYGSNAGGYFRDTDSGTWSEVAVGSTKILSTGSCDFVQNHPEDPERVIVYACPEGDEVATYTRGTARLQNGVARVPLGETFKWVTNPDIGLTAHLTPRGRGTVLCVQSLTTEEMVVRSMEGFPDDVVFDYLVYGLRIGFEEVGTVQEKEREAYIPSMEEHRALYERRPELRDYNALERFKRMRATAGQTGPLDLSASQALHDAIVEFDPAVHSLDDRRKPGAPEPIEIGEDRPREQRPYRPELADPKDTELVELRARVEALEALVARLAAPQNGGE